MLFMMEQPTIFRCLPVGCYDMIGVGSSTRTLVIASMEVIFFQLVIEVKGIIVTLIGGGCVTDCCDPSAEN